MKGLNFDTLNIIFAPQPRLFMVDWTAVKLKFLFVYIFI